MSVSRRGLLAAAGATAVASSGVLLGSGTAQASPGKQPVDATPYQQQVPPPFMKLPVRARDARGSLAVTNGWFNSADENPITGNDVVVHGAVDLEFVNTPDNGYGLPILATADGVAYYSYQYLQGQWTDPATGITHQLGFGAGLVVETRHKVPGYDNVVVQYIHLSRVADGIPYLGAQAVGDGDWTPTGLFQANETLWAAGAPVKAGQVIGYQGDTGIGLDWFDDFDGVHGVVNPRDRKAKPPWDPPQLHWQGYLGRNPNGFGKIGVFDIYGKYGQVRPGEYHTEFAQEYNPYGDPGCPKVGPRTTLLVDAHGNPLYAAA